jgi:hypothetical protein
MAASGHEHEPLRTITFARRGAHPFHGEVTIRGTHFEDCLLTSSIGVIPQDACDAVMDAKVQLAEGPWPDAYYDAISALARVSDTYLFDKL